MGRTGCHGSTTSGPNVFNSNFNPLLFLYIRFLFAECFIYFFPPSLPTTISLFIPPPLLLYGKTFLMLYSASVKPGAYFLCPKLIANVRSDPPTLTSSLFGISSNDTWNIFATILNPGVLCFWRCSPLYLTACVFVEVSREKKSTDCDWLVDFLFFNEPPAALCKPSLVSLSCLYP